MLFVKAQAMNSAAEIGAALMQAARLEHATIPLYLTAYYSLQDIARSNRDISTIIRDIVVEEMFHLSLLCNLLNAIGSPPLLDDASFVPAYPGPLPMDIGTKPGDPPFVVSLEPFSLELVTRQFLVIEEPKQPLDYPLKARAKIRTLAETPYRTIDQFYDDLIQAIQAQGDALFTGDPQRQAVDEDRFDDPLIAVTNAATAVQALQLIVKQGEGTAQSPFEDPQNQKPSHYYRFMQIVKGKSIVPDAAARFSYSGAPIVFAPQSVLPLCHPSQPLPAGSDVANLADAFDLAYTKMLRHLHAVYNGKPAELGDAVNEMAPLTKVALALVRTPVPGTALNGCPRFRYVAAV